MWCGSCTGSAARCHTRSASSGNCAGAAWPSARSTEHLDTASRQGEPLFAVFGVLAQYERALIRERVVADLRAALEGGMSKAAACRTFGVRRTTLIEALRRVG